jgi:hypothetical protein
MIDSEASKLKKSEWEEHKNANIDNVIASETRPFLEHHHVAFTDKFGKLFMLPAQAADGVVNAGSQAEYVTTKPFWSLYV